MEFKRTFAMEAPTNIDVQMPMNNRLNISSKRTRETSGMTDELVYPELLCQNLARKWIQKS
jgi:hypothetical protein